MSNQGRRSFTAEERVARMEAELAAAKQKLRSKMENAVSREKDKLDVINTQQAKLDERRKVAQAALDDALEQLHSLSSVPSEEPA